MLYVVDICTSLYEFPTYFQKYISISFVLAEAIGNREFHSSDIIAF